MAAWGNNFFKKNFFLLFFHFSAPLKCHWPIRASSLKSHSPAGRIYSPLATGRVLMKRLFVVAFGYLTHHFGRCQGPMNCHFAHKGMQLQWC